MSAFRFLGALTVAATIAGPALAQPADTMAPPPADPSARSMPDPSMPDPSMPSAPPAEQSGVNTSGVVLLSSPTPPDQVSHLKAGDPTVISNQPVADTPENRAKYGPPMSNAGRRTAPQGN